MKVIDSPRKCTYTQNFAFIIRDPQIPKELSA